MKKRSVQATLFTCVALAVSDSSKEYVTQLANDRFSARTVYKEGTNKAYSAHYVGKIDTAC